MHFLVRRKTIIKELATSIANLQRKADEVYYKDNPPKKNDNDYAAWLIDQVEPLRKLSVKLGIGKKVYEEAYRIYDFRNSGKDGYTLKDGKIVKIN